jgi:hypothetical protein
MGLPTNYTTQEPQLERRWKSLNDLRYYGVEFSIVMNEEFENKLKDETIQLTDDNGEPMGEPIAVYPMFWEGWMDLGIHNFHHTEKEGFKRFSALDDDKAKEKFTEWLDNLVKIKTIDSYKIKDFNENTLEEELDETGILPILNLEGRN